MREQILEVLQNVNARIIDDDKVNLLEAGLIDSFEIVNVVMGLESVFDIEIEPELIVPDNFKNINSIVDLIKKICAEK